MVVEEGALVGGTFRRKTPHELLICGPESTRSTLDCGMCTYDLRIAETVSLCLPFSEELTLVSEPLQDEVMISLNV